MIFHVVFLARKKHTEVQAFPTNFGKMKFLFVCISEYYLEEADANADASDHGDVALDLLGEAGEAAFGVDLHCRLEQRV